MKQHQPSHPHGLLCLPQLFNMLPISKNAWRETYLSGRYPKPEILAPPNGNHCRIHGKPEQSGGESCGNLLQSSQGILNGNGLFPSGIIADGKRHHYPQVQKQQTALSRLSLKTLILSKMHSTPLLIGRRVGGGGKRTLRSMGGKAEEVEHFFSPPFSRSLHFQLSILEKQPSFLTG